MWLVARSRVTVRLLVLAKLNVFTCATFEPQTSRLAERVTRNWERFRRGQTGNARAGEARGAEDEGRAVGGPWGCRVLLSRDRPGDHRSQMQIKQQGRRRPRSSRLSAAWSCEVEKGSEEGRSWRRGCGRWTLCACAGERRH